MPRAAGVHHLAIKVADLPAMEKFYGEVLGLPVVRRWQHEGGADAGRDRSVWLDLGNGGVLALEIAPHRSRTVDEPAASQAGEEGPGFFLLALRIEKAERVAWRAKLAAAGHPVSHETSFTIYFRDPEGNRLGLSHFPEPA